MEKKYTDYMDELSADELYEGLLAYGFSLKSFHLYLLLYLSSIIVKLSIILLKQDGMNIYHFVLCVTLTSLELWASQILLNINEYALNSKKIGIRYVFIFTCRQKIINTESAEFTFAKNMTKSESLK